MSAALPFATALKGLAKMQVDVITKVAKMAVEEATSAGAPSSSSSSSALSNSANSIVLCVLERLEAILLVPPPSSAAAARPDPAKVMAAVACFCVIDMFVNAKKLQSLASSGAAGEGAAMAIADAFVALLPNAMTLLRQGNLCFDANKAAAAAAGSSSTSGSAATGSSSSSVVVTLSAAQQQQFAMFVKQVEPFTKQWAGIGADLMARLKAPIAVNATAASPSAASAGGNGGEESTVAGATDNAASSTAPTAAPAAPTATSSVALFDHSMRLSSAEAGRRANIIGIVTALITSLGMPTCPLPLHKREQYNAQLYALLKKGQLTAEGQQQQQSLQGAAKLSRRSTRGGAGALAPPPPPSPTDISPSTSALFDAMMVLYEAIKGDLAVYGEAALATHLTTSMGMGAAGDAAGAKRGRSAEGAGDDNADSDGATAKMAAAEELLDQSPEAVQRRIEAARVAFTTPITLESDTQRYLPITLQLAGGAAPPMAGASGASGYGAPHTFMSLQRSIAEAVRDVRGRIMCDRSEVRQLFAAHGIAPNAIELAMPGPFRVPPSAAAVAAGGEDGDDLLPIDGLTEEERMYMSRQQQADRRGLSASLAMLGALHRGTPFSPSGLLVFPTPEGYVGAPAASPAEAALNALIRKDAVMPLASLRSRQEALQQGSGDASATAPPLPIQRAWAPSVAEWLGARDMAQCPVLRFK